MYVYFFLQKIKDYINIIIYIMESNQINILLTNQGALIDLKKNAIDNIIQKALKNKFTIKNIQPTGFKSYLSQIIILKNFILLPRFGAFLLPTHRTIKINKKTVNITNNIKDVEINNNIKYGGILNNNQQLITKHIMNNIFNDNIANKGQSGCILKLKAGQGKSFIGMALIGELKRKTLIMVHNTNMLFQWNKFIVNNFNGIKIGLIYSNEKTSGDIIIGVINSLVNEDFNFFKDIGFCIVDECHYFCSKQWSEIFKKCQARYMLGLSATPDRSDGFGIVAQWNIGPILDAEKINGYINDVETKFIAKVDAIKYYAPAEYCKYYVNDSNKMINNSKMIEQITLDPYRTQIVVDKIKELYNKGLNIFVFADRRNYLDNIKNMLTDFKEDSIFMLEKDDDVSKLVGGSSNDDIEKATQNARIILTTYQYMGTGKSIQKMNGMVLATPRKTGCEQFISRIFRLGSDNRIERIIVDIIDFKSSLKTQWYHRKRYYDSMEYKIEEMKIIK